MDMSNWIAGTLAVIFSVLVIARAPGALANASRVRLWLAHVVMTLSLWLSVTPVYLAVDAMLGGRNITNLLSHFGFYVIFWLGGAEVALAIGRHDLFRLIHGAPGVLVMVTGAAAMTAVFIAAAPEYSAMGLNPFRDDPMIILYKTLSFVYPGFAAAVLALPLLRASLVNPGLLGGSMRLMASGFILVPLVPIAHMGELVDSGYALVVDLVLYPAIILVAAGVTVAFVSRLRATQTSSLGNRQQAEQAD